MARHRWSACGSEPRFRRSPDCTHWRRPTWPTTTGSAVHAATPMSAVGSHCWPTSSPAGTQVPAPVLAAVVHGELLTLAPFGTADGVVARAVSRLVTIASGLDPHGLGVPEVYWMRQSGDYRAAARGFSSGTPDGLAAWLVLSAARFTRRRAGGADHRAGRVVVRSPSNVKRATLRTDSARRPLARTPVTKRALWVAWVASASLRCASTATPPKGSSWPSALRNYAGPQHFYLFRGMCSAWVPGSVLGSLASGDRAFSSGSVLASPGFRGSFVLRDRGHIKGQIAGDSQIVTRRC